MNPKLRKVLIYSTVVFIAATTVDFFRSDFFNVTPRVLIIFGSLLILLSILLYYYSLLSSQEILNIRYNLRIYFSVAILVHTLCFSPLDFLSNYFNTTTGNELFVAFRAQVIFILNILLYLTYTIAFLVCSRKRN
ncbi:hypothetical protein [Marinirhabdus gelatinilytica]|nr:hypothetical protein [Marinirhabdus gelatinilytica]